MNFKRYVALGILILVILFNYYFYYYFTKLWMQDPELFDDIIKIVGFGSNNFYIELIGLFFVQPFVVFLLLIGELMEYGFFPTRDLGYSIFFTIYHLLLIFIIYKFIRFFMMLNKEKRE